MQRLWVLVVLVCAVLPVKPTRARAQSDLRPVQSVAWSPDGRLLAVAPGAYIAEEHDYAVRIVDATQSAVVEELKYHLGQVTSVDWSSDGTKLVTTGGSDNMAVVWDTETWQIVSASQPYSMPPRMADLWQPSTTLIANLSQGIDVITLWDGLTGQDVRRLTERSLGRPEAIAWSPNGSQLVASYDSGAFVIWDAATGAILDQWEGVDQAVLSIEWDPAGRYMATAGMDLSISIWDATTRGRVALLEGHSDAIPDLAWSPEGARIASASLDGTVRIWDWREETLLVQYPYGEDALTVDWSAAVGAIAFGGANRASADLVVIESLL